MNSDAGQIAYLPRLMRLLTKEMPRARLRVVGVDTYISSGGIAGTEVDVAIVAVAVKAPGVHVTPLYKEESVLVAHRDHPYVRVQVTKKQLGSFNTLMSKWHQSAGTGSLPVPTRTS